MSRFDEKVVIVTGAASGIGEETSKEFARRGAFLSLVDVDAQNLTRVSEECRNCGSGKVLKIVADLSKLDDVEKVVKETIEHFKKLHVLVSNAGIITASASLAETTTETYDAAFNVNVRAPLFLAKAAIPELLKTKGCIVNTSSIAAVIPKPLTLIYSMTKAALDHMTRCLAQELAPRGIRVNNVNPGVTRTPIWKHLNPSELQLRMSTKYQPLGVLEPANVAHWIVFLSSDESGPVTGQSHVVDGGHILMRLAGDMENTPPNQL